MVNVHISHNCNSNKYARCIFAKRNSYIFAEGKHYFRILVAMPKPTYKPTYKPTSTRLSIGFMDKNITDDTIINAITSITNMSKNYYYTIRQDRITKSNLIIVKWFKKLILTPLTTASINITMISVIKHLLETLQTL